MERDEKFFIRKLVKVFSEDVDKYWWFDIEKYFKLAAKYDYNGEQIHKAIECVEPDENKKVVSAKTIDRVLGYYNGIKEGKGDKSITIATAKALGKALCDGDEYGLLIKIEPSNVMLFIKEAEKLWGTSDINYIYGLMNKILYELETSTYYSYKPGTDEDGFEYYDMRLQSIRNEIDSRFWSKNEVRAKLYGLVEEIEELVKSYSQPGAPERWMKANPKLRYFDCVFDFMEQNPNIYQLVKKGNFSTGWGQTVSFNFYPTEQECIDRRKYFAELAIKNDKNNSKYSEVRFYQNELVDAFRIVFEDEFK